MPRWGWDEAGDALRREFRFPDFAAAFEGIDSNLLFTTVGVILVILLLIYRSPVFLPVLISAGIALVLAFFFKAPPLRQKSAMEEAMQARAEQAQLEADASAPGSVSPPVTTASNPVVRQGDGDRGRS